jgi:serine/threonine-protein kinase
VSQELIFGKYEIIRRLALGGMGEVFLARQTGVAGFDRLVILKSLLPELAEQEGFVEQFLDEARVAATLNHPNIVAIYEVGLWNGTYFIAMEHIHGDDLARMQKAAAKAKVGVPFQVSARVILDAALGLDHAHHAKDMQHEALNIVHRDISPQNIMVRGDGVTKVVDFGIAKASNRSTRTATGMLKGKLQYMPPEQVRGETLDGRSDQFALGVVLWELCTGRRLFKAENELQTLEKVLKERIPRPTEIVPGFPEQLEAVIMRMLARNPAERYERCKDAADGLREYLEACSRSVGETEVAEFVQRVLGDELTERTKNITPNEGKNFLISFDGSGPNTPSGGSGPNEIAATPTTSRTYAELNMRRSRNVAAIASAISAAVILAALAVVFLVLPDDTSDEIEPPQVAATPPDGEPPADSKPPPTKRKPVVRAAKAKTGATVLEIDEPVGATVLIDGKQWKEKVPTVVTGLSPGPHKVVLQPLEGEPLEESVEVAASPAVLALVSTPAGATVWVGGRQMGTTPFETTNLLPGMDHEVQLTLKGHASQTVTVKLAPGETVKRTVELEKHKRVARTRPPAAGETKIIEKETIVYRDREVPTKPKGLGFLTLHTQPWAKVSIDGQPYGSTPLFKIKLEPGKHTVKLVNEQEGVNVTRNVVVKSGQNLKQKWSLK